MFKKFFGQSLLQTTTLSRNGPVVGLIRSFSISAPAASKRSALRKPNYSSLSKHLKPDGLTGRERRDVLRTKLKENRPKSSRAPYIPVKRRLEAIPGNTSTRNDRNELSKPESVGELSARLATQTFDDLGLLPAVVNAARHGHLKNLEDPRPSEIQALTIPQLVRSNQHCNVLVAAETGSGKTLAYMLPIIDSLKREEEASGSAQVRRLDRPRAIVLVPTRELVTQVVQTSKTLAHLCKFRAIGLDGKVHRRQLVEHLEMPVDVLATTPTTLWKYVKDGTLSLTDVKYLVTDEADSLFDSGWGDEVKQIMDKVKVVGKKDAKFVIVTATLPRSVHRTLDSLFGKDLVKITTPSLHRALPNLKQSFVDLTRFNGNRQLALLEVLKKNIKDEKTLIFCNTRKSAELLQDWLKTKNLSVLALHKDADRKETLSLFSAPSNGDEATEVSHNVMISTDIASRGIDTTFVDHVVLYDFPASVVDYLHRVGRTARAGRTGKATSLIGRKDRMMADRIQRAIREGSVLT